MKYITTQPITIPAGTEFEVDDTLSDGGLHHMNDYGLMRVFLGRAAALREGIVIAKPGLSLVKS